MAMRAPMTNFRQGVCTMHTQASLTTSELKAQARNYRASQEADGHTVSHAQALEMVARFNGFRDWNTAAAILPHTQTIKFTIGQRISGRYLKQPFVGTILGIETIGAGDYQKLTLHFDTPVDVISFDSFSAFRQRVVATVDRNGVSPAKTSDGVPHLVLQL